ncbi:MAG: DUF1735 domain-containing protein [Alistipes sp.]|nr:DUF1735 domain-containing protein [Alistipes sp.]
MKHIINSGLRIAAAILLVAGAVSCADDIKMPDEDQSKYDRVDTVYGYVQNAVSPASRLVDLYTQDVERAIEVGLTNTLDKIVTFELAVSQTALDEYNSRNGFDYEMFPSSLVSLETSSIAIAPGYKVSESIGVTLSPSAELTVGTTYAVPIRISPDASEVELTSEQRDYFFFVTAKGDRLSPAKNSGFLVVSCIETGDVDPRIHLELLLENEGKLLTDVVILFSANCNYNEATGQVYVHMNNSITPILNNREKYLKPLQDAGIKVVLGILGNHDPAGIGYMDDDTNIQFVNELKRVIDTYELDGVFWDDEYTAANPEIPGFIESSFESAAHLLYTAKRLMPDKLNMAYQYQNLRPSEYIYVNGRPTGVQYLPLPAVNGIEPINFIDFVIADYGDAINNTCYPNLPTKQGMPYSWELNLARTGNPSSVKSGDWAGIMVFALSEHRDNWESYQLPSLQTVARTLFDDDLYYTGVSYEVEW